MRILVFVALALVAGCASPVQRASGECSQMGYVEGSLAHSGCVERRVAAEDAYWRNFSARVRERYRSQARQPVVNCTSTRVGYQTFTTCR